MNYLSLYGGFRDEKASSEIALSQDGRVLSASEPWHLIKNPLLRFLCHLHLSSNINARFPLPFRSVWNRVLFRKHFKNSSPLCVIFNAHFYEMENAKSLQYIRKHFPGAKIVLQFPDRYQYFRNNYKRFPTFQQLLKSYDAVITYNVEDARTYGFTLERPLIGSYESVPVDPSIPSSDIFFVGQHKGRLPLLISIYEKCTAAGLVCDFHIVGVPESEQQYADTIIYNQRISYEEVLKRVKRTKCVLNLAQEGGTGVTMRDYEAMGNNRLLLTNNYFLKETELYHDDQVIWIEDLETRIEDIRAGFQGSRDYSELYSKKRWYEWLERILL